MDCVAAFVHPFPGRADAEALVRAYREVARLEDDGSVESFRDLFIEPLLVSVRIGEPGIAVTEFIVCDVCVDAVLDYHLHVLFGVEAAVAGQFGLFEDVFFFPDRLEVLPRSFDHGFQYCGFGVSGRLCMDHDLMLAVDHRYAVVALDDAVGGLHVGAFIVGDVALPRFALAAGLVVVFLEPGFDLFDLRLEGGNVLLFLLYDRLVGLGFVSFLMLAR